MAHNPALCLDDVTIVIERGDDGLWIASIPEIRGAVSQGRTATEARKNVLDALSELMAARRESAMQALRPGATVERIPLGATRPPSQMTVLRYCLGDGARRFAVVSLPADMTPRERDNLLAHLRIDLLGEGDTE